MFGPCRVAPSGMKGRHALLSLSVQAAFRTSTDQPATSGYRVGTFLSVSTPLTRQWGAWSIRWVMKTLVSKDALKRMALCICFLSVLPIAQAAEPIPNTMTADRWQTKENVEFFRQLGLYHGLMRLNSGDAVLKDITFSDGTIEFDFNTIGRGARSSLSSARRR